MKKFFAIVAVALVAFGFASCNGNNPSANAFKITVSDITATGATIEVVPADTAATYYWDILEASEAAKMDDEAVGTYLKELLEEAVEYYTYYGYDVVFEDFLVKGKDSYDYTKLTAETEYTVVAIALDKDGKSSGAASRQNFKTLAEEVVPVPDNMTFQIAVDDITYSGASVSVTPSIDDATYYWNVFETADIDGMSDADLGAALKSNIEYIIQMYAYYGQEFTIADFLSEGADAYDFAELDSETEYTVVAVAMNAQGTTNGAVAKKNFKTAEVVAQSEVTLDFHDALIKDYRDYDGSFMIIAAPADSSVVVLLTPYSDEFVGDFTQADLDPDYSGIVIKADQKSYTVAKAAFDGTLRSREEDYFYSGWFIASNLVKYSFEFSVPADESAFEQGGEEGGANVPAKKVAGKVLDKKNAFLKKGNIEKNVRRSEKLFNR